VVTHTGTTRGVPDAKGRRVKTPSDLAGVADGT
jgi:hypothetical protein